MKTVHLPDNEAAQRSALYGVLSRVFLHEPDQAIIHYLKTDEVQEILRGLGLSFGDDFLKTDEEMLVREIALEYVRLFLAPPTHLPPYESFFVGGLQQPEETFEPALQGKAAAEVQTFYREHGILFPEGSKLLPDHIGIELEALRLLCDLESKSVASGHPDSVRHIRRTTGTFLMEHPHRWVPDFCDQILKRTEIPYFRVVALLTKAFIASELEDLIPCCEKKEEVIQ